MDPKLQQAIKILEHTSACPRMIASTKEALIMRCSTIVELFVKDYYIINFYKRHLKIDGPCVLGLTEEFTNEWARAVVADALELLPKE